MTDTHANPATIKVAVATKGLGQVDLHFGHADDFHIYAAGPGGIHYIEKRLVEHYCQGGFGDEDKREVIIRALADCAGLLVAKVGDGPKKRLLDAGIEAVDDYAYGATEDSIKAWYQKRLALNAGGTPAALDSQPYGATLVPPQVDPPSPYKE